MVLRQEEQLLIDFLNTSKISEGMQAAIYMTVQGHELEMCRFLSDNPEVTGEEALNKAREIAMEEQEQ